MITNRTRQRGGWRRALAASAATLVATAGMSAISTEAASASTAKWSGYRIRTCSYADCNWMGGRVLPDGTKVYRIQPRKAQRDYSFRSPTLVSDLNGGSAPSARSTAISAYVLANYGAYRDSMQAAGVDTATYHLLRGGSWRLGQARANARTRQTGHGSAVRSYAKSMIANAQKYAGPYKQAVSSTLAAVGSSSKVTYRITSAAGYGMRNLPVKLTYGGTSVDGYTDASGYATAYFTVTQAGAATVTAAAGRVPEWRLVLRTPTSSRPSAVAQAGVLRTLYATGTVTGSGGQSVSIANGSALRMVGQGLDGTYTLNGGTGARNVGRYVYGPFNDSSGACSGTPAFSSVVSTDANGTFALPSYASPKSGHYRWSVYAAANAYSTQAGACGAPVRVQKQAAIAQYRPGTQVRFGIGKPFRIGARISGFDRSETHTVTGRLYGPYNVKENAACGSRLFRSVTATVTGNGDYLLPSVSVGSSSNAGWYIWQSTLTSGDLIRGGTSTCGGLFQIG
jgi:hypothetical protein